MPTYDYRCKACGQELEVFQSFSDDPLTTCEACGGQLRKLFGAPGIAFKGSGFYKNDSRGSSKSSSVAASGESSTSTSDSSSSTDSKGSESKGTDTKADTKKADTKKKDKAAPAAASKT